MRVCAQFTTKQERRPILIFRASFLSRSVSVSKTRTRRSDLSHSFSLPRYFIPLAQNRLQGLFCRRFDFWRRLRSIPNKEDAPELGTSALLANDEKVFLGTLILSRRRDCRKLRRLHRACREKFSYSLTPCLQNRNTCRKV